MTKRYGIWSFILISLIVHVSGFVPKIIGDLLPDPSSQTEPVLSEEERLALLEAQELAASQALLAQRKMTLREQMQQSFESIAEDVDQKFLAEVWEQVEENITESFEDLEFLLADQEFDGEEFDQQYMDLSANMFEQTGELLKNILRKELLAAISKQVREHTSPTLAKNVEQRLKDTVGSREERRLSKAARSDTAERKRQAMKDIDALRQKVEKLSAQQHNLGTTSGQLESASETTQSDREAIGEKQKKLQESLSDIQKDMDALQDAIRKNLPDVAHRIKKKNTDALENAALDRAEAEQQSAQEILADADSKEKASQDMKQARDELRTAARSLQQLRREVSSGPPTDNLAKESLKKLIDEDLKKEAKASFDKSLAERLVPKSTERIIKQAKLYLDDFHMDTDRELMDALNVRVKELLIDGVPKDMKDSAENLAMKQTEKKNELDAVTSKDAKLQLSHAQKQSFAKQVTHPMSEQRHADIQRQLDESVRSAELGDMSDAMDELRAKLKMMNQAEQIAKSIREGRGDMAHMEELSELMKMLGEGDGPQGAHGYGVPGAGRGPGQAIYDRQRVKRIKDIAEKRGKPGVVYAQLQKEADKLISKSVDFPQKRPSTIVDPRDPVKEIENPSEQEKRPMFVPNFKSIKFGYAAMVREKVVLDGNLDEWDLKRAQYAQLTYTLSGDVTTLPKEKSVPFYMMWSHDGFYLAATIRTDARDITPSPHRFWDGDSVEIWIDKLNNRAPLMTYVEASQMWFMPFGTITHPNIVSGFNHGYHIGDASYVDRNGKDTRRMTREDTRLQHAHKDVPGGHQIEIFIPQTSLYGPKLKAGKYLGFMLIFNAVHGQRDVGWAPRQPNSYERPDTWGDVLLLGSDGEISFSKDVQGKQTLDLFTPGEPVQIHVHDPDMNTDPLFKDQISVRAIGSDGHVEIVILGETEMDSGKFTGGINTHSSYIGERAGSLAVTPGELFRVRYVDQRRDYGESRKDVEATLAVGWPVLKLSKH